MTESEESQPIRLMSRKGAMGPLDFSKAAEHTTGCWCQGNGTRTYSRKGSADAGGGEVLRAVRLVAHVISLYQLDNPCAAGRAALRKFSRTTQSLSLRRRSRVKEGNT